MKIRSTFILLLLICLALMLCACNLGESGTTEAETENTLEEGCSHVFLDPETVPATCTRRGETKTICSICGGILTKYTEIDPTNHIFEEWILDCAPTCTNQGSEHRACSECGYKEERAIAIAPDKHVTDGWTVVTAPGCSSAGEERLYCTLCLDVIESREISRDPAVHVAGDWTTVTPATCISEGEEARYCTDCSASLETRVISIDKDGHSYDVVSIIKSTCVSTGIEALKCKLCGDECSTELAIDETAHSFGDAYASLGAYHAAICTLCGQTGAPTEHTSDELLNNALCHYKRCTVCGESFDHADHTFEAVTTPPTYLEGGSTTEKCLICGYTTLLSSTDPLEKLTPEYTLPVITCPYGTKLSEIELPEGFSFEYPTLFAGSVGQNTHSLTYTVPGDTEGKYLTVSGIEITVTVLPLELEIAYDASDLADLVYTGECAPDPEIPAELLHLVKLRWYQGDTLLNSAPVNAGDYTLELYIDDPCYSADPVTVDFTIEKAQSTIDPSIITNRGYTGLPVSFNIDASLGLTLEFVDENGDPAPTPIEKGDYFVRVTSPETQNYLSASFIAPFSIVTDVTAPTWTVDRTVVVSDGRQKYTLPAIDDGAVKYFSVTPINDVRMIDCFTTVSAEIEIEMGVMYIVNAYDYAGNQSEELYIYVRPENEYVPQNVYPAINSTLNQSYVSLFAENATVYYFGTDPEALEEIDGSFIPSLTAGVTYYWRAECVYLESPIYSFNVSYEGERDAVLIYPEDKAVITDKTPELIATSSKKGNIMVARVGSTVFTEYDPASFGFQYGMQYVWCYQYEDGTKSEQRTFTYMHLDGSPKDAINVFTSKSIQRFDNILASGTSVAGIQYFSYYAIHTDGTGAVSYSTAATLYELKDGSIVTNIRDFQNGDRVVITAVDNHYSKAIPIVVLIDLEAPTLGTVTDHGDGRATITLGSDNGNATFEYRIGMGEWTTLTDDTVVDLVGMLQYVELRAVDEAGNDSYQSYYLGSDQGVTAPAIKSGVVGTPTNRDVTLLLTPTEGGECYYYINGEQFPLTEELLLNLTDDGEYVVWTCEKDGFAYKYSEPLRVIIDKTAPVIGDLFYKSDRYSLNNDYQYITLDLNAIVESSDWTIEYMMREVNENYKPLNDARVPLYSYYIAESGYWYVDLKVTDAAGNSTVATATLFIDSEGPTISEGKIKYEYDEESGITRCLIVFDSIVDDFGYYYHMHFQIWDGDLADSSEEGVESMINISFYTKEGENSFVYDATDLEDGKKYYFLAYVTDDLINATYSQYYYFTKETPQSP